MRALLPRVRATRTRILALFVLGAIWTGQVTVPRVAAALPVAVADVSTERRLQRLVANQAVVVGEVWSGLLPALLAGRAGQELTLVFDPTPHQGTVTILVLGPRRLGLAWFHDLLQRDRCPLLPFHRRHGQWRFVWLA